MIRNGQQTLSTPNRVTDAFGAIGGGRGNRAGNCIGAVDDAGYATVGGGERNTASGDSAFVAGGGGSTASDGNEAFAHYSATLGGRSNLTGDSALVDPTIEQSSCISGGENNSASGPSSSVSGGYLNSASGSRSSVSGGYNNTASGECASIFGSLDLTISADYGYAP